MIYWFTHEIINIIYNNIDHPPPLFEMLEQYFPKIDPALWTLQYWFFFVR